jgi:hypothetical protein
VTRTRVPNGRLLCAAVNPWPAEYTEAMPVSACAVRNKQADRSNTTTSENFFIAGPLVVCYAARQRHQPWLVRLGKTSSPKAAVTRSNLRKVVIEFPFGEACRAEKSAIVAPCQTKLLIKIAHSRVRPLVARNAPSTKIPPRSEQHRFDGSLSFSNGVVISAGCCFNSGCIVAKP